MFTGMGWLGMLLDMLLGIVGMLLDIFPGMGWLGICGKPGGGPPGSGPARKGGLR